MNAENNWSTVPGSYVYEFTDVDDAEGEDSSMFGYVGCPGVHLPDGTSADYKDNSAFSEGRNEWTFEEVKHTYYWRAAAILADVAGKSSVTVTHYAIDNETWPYGSTLGEGSGSAAAPYLDKNIKDPDNVSLYGWCYFQQNFRPLTAALPPVPEKTVDKEEAEIDDVLNYTVTQQVTKQGSDGAEDYTYESVVFKDTLPKGVSYAAGTFKVLDTEGRDITDRYGKLDVDGRKLTYTFDKTYLENELKYNGNSFTFSWQAKVLDSAAGKTLENQAHVILNDDYDLESNIVTTKVKAWDVSVEKLSAYDEVLVDNTAYSLENAVFEMRDKVEHLITTFITDGDGKAGPTRIKHAGEYTLTEVTPPLGHKLSDPNWQSIILDNDNANTESPLTYTFVNEPLYACDEFRYIAVKSDTDYYFGAALGENSEHLLNSDWWQGSTIDFSDCKVKVELYQFGADINTAEPLASAVFQADKLGRIAFRDATPVDDTTWRYRYKDCNIMPLGHVVVTEVSPPDGYVLDNRTHEALVVANKDSTGVDIKPGVRWVELDWDRIFDWE